MSESKPEILPCPFCGVKLIEIRTETTFLGWEHPRDKTCILSLHQVLNRPNYIELWNRRTAPASVADDGYVHYVPDKCERIVWHGQYYHLPIKGKAHE